MPFKFLRRQFIGVLLFAPTIASAQLPGFWRNTNGPMDTIFSAPAVDGLGVDGAGRMYLSFDNGVYMNPGTRTGWVPGTGNSTTPLHTLRTFTFSNRGVTFATELGGNLDISRDSGFNWTSGPHGVGDSGDGVGGVTVNTLIARDSLLFCGTQHGLFVSSDEGSHWKTLLGTPRKSLLSWPAYAFYVSDNGTYLVGSTSAVEVLRSTDTGVTWDTIRTFKYGASLLGGSGRVLYAVAGGTGILFKSTDEGAHWAHIVPALDSMEVFDMQVFDSNHVALEINRATKFTNRVFTTDDGWATWHSSVAGLGMDSAIGPTMAYAAENKNGIVVIATDQGLYVSYDSARSWQHEQPRMWQPNPVNAFITALHPAVNGQLFASSSAHGVFRSADDGATWSSVRGDLPTKAVGAFGVDPFGTWYAGTDSGMYRSTNSGLNWSRRNTGIPSSTFNAIAFNVVGNVYAATNAGLYRSIDEGESWEHLKKGLPADSILSVLVDDSARVFAGTYFGVFISTDYGTTWNRFHNGIEYEWVHAMAIGKHGERYVGVENNGVLRFLPGVDSSWQTFGGGLDFTTVHSLAVDVNGFMYAATDSGPFRIAADGTNWQRLPFTTASQIGSTAIAINAHGYCFAEGNGEVWRSEATIAGIGPDRKQMFAAHADIFPNPVSTVAQLALTNSVHGWLTVTISNALGMEISSIKINSSSDLQRTLMLNVEALSPGAYFVRVQSSALIQTSFFLKK